MQTTHTYGSPWERRGPGRAVLIAFGLGISFGLGFTLAKLSTHLVDFGLYLISLSLFHLWEYLYVVVYHPENLTADAFMVNHSKEFNLALALGLTEYFIEWLFFPSMKGNCVIYIIGFLIAVAGQSLRTIAMMTAGSNFSHYIASEKKPNHTLVKHGVYSVVRHPSYTGWFTWSVGTQIVLGNPICAVLYAIVAFIFFKKRISYEEQTLVSHFGQEYVQYKRDVPSGIPLVK